MYDIDGLIPGIETNEIPPGKSLLVTGPAMAGKETFALDLLAEGAKHGEAVIIVTTNRSAEEMREAYGQRVPDADDLGLGVIDCASQEGSAGHFEESQLVRHLSSPGDLTGIGVEFAKIGEHLGATNGDRGLRVCLSSVSTLLMYLDASTVFRFLHAFTSRIKAQGWFGVFTMDTSMHDQQTVSTIKATFDGVVQLAESDDGPTVESVDFANV